MIYYDNNCEDNYEDNKSDRSNNGSHHSKLAILFFILALFSVFVSGCGSTLVNSNHILIAKDKDIAAALVYFIRPNTYRERGIADNPVKIELNRKEIIALGKGEYTMVRIKPVEATITTRNFSMFTNKLLPIEMTRSANMTFDPGETYFIHIKQVNEEFRGVYYLPELIGLTTAKRMSADLKSTGIESGADIEKL